MIVPCPTDEDALFAVRTPSEMAREAHRLEPESVAAGALAATLVASSPPPSLRDRVLATASHRGRGRYAIFADRIARLFDIDVDTALDVLARAEDPAAFDPSADGTVAFFPVPVGPRCAGGLAVIGLLQPGASFPRHTHLGEETTLVLEGGFREPDGAEVWRGDERAHAAGTDHAFVVVGETPCVAAVLAKDGVAFTPPA